MEGGRDTRTNRRTTDDQPEILRIRHNVARNPIRKVPNTLLASAPGKELHPPILITPDMHGGQVNIYRDMNIVYKNPQSEEDVIENHYQVDLNFLAVPMIG